MKQHRLVGLETDNLLGFLALLGLLRSLEQVRPYWSARAYCGGTPVTFWLDLTHEVLPTEIADAAAEGCASYAEAFRFGEYKDLNFDTKAARELLLQSLLNASAASVMSTLCSDAAIKQKGDRIIPTQLCAMFGQGHQSFLSRLSSVSKGEPPKVLRSQKKPPDLNGSGFIERALFHAWKREDRTESFRWDFEEDRRYALRYADPSSEPPVTEHGANRLATLGLISFQSAPTTTRSGVPDLSTRAVSRESKSRRVRITWPIWLRPASLNAIHAMLDEPELHKDKPSFSVLARLGIDQARRVIRMKNGKFISFSRAEPLVPSEDFQAAAAGSGMPGYPMAFE